MAAHSPIERVDAFGIEHPIALPNPRIVSLVPSITELLFTMDLGAHVVGRTRYCVHPSTGLAKIVSVGGTKRLALEHLRRLQPTHVITNKEENLKSDVEALREFVPNVVVTYPLSPRDNLTLYRLLGGIFNREAQAEQLCYSFEQRYDQLIHMAGPTHRRKVLYLIWRKPWMSVSIDTYIGQMMSLIGWQTPFSNPTDRYPCIPPGDPLVASVDKVLFSTEPFEFKAKHYAEFERQFDVEAARLSSIDGELMSWYGSRAIAGLDYLASLCSSS